ncbi:MAG: exodeoxyribonuclease VII large subunit [Bacteroidales bacterium]|nr:exodeoxyribonuclease VII large subunit [Bacteroidales bacterium]
MTLLEIQERLRESIDSSFPGAFWVTAEISSLSTRANNHCYIDLVQTDGGRVVASARAIVWANRWWSLSAFFQSETGSSLQPGLSVLVQVKVGYSPVYGLSFVINDIDPQYTLGDQEAQKRKTIERLENEGRMDRQKELCVSDLPRRLAVISSETGAGYGDFMKHLSENARGFTFATELFPAMMQGGRCPESVAEAIAAVEASGRTFDAVVLMRGGGANMDLACFDAYEMCAAIADCSLPVLSAVGHERDHHVCDMVACRNYKTPTALADAIIAAITAEDDRIADYTVRLKLAFKGKLALMEGGLARMMDRIGSSSKRLVAVNQARLDLLETRIRAADPRAIISRGYALALDGSGRVVRNASALHGGDSMSLMFADGTVRAKVDYVELKS